MSEKKIDESWKDKVAQEKAKPVDEKIDDKTQVTQEDSQKENENFEMPPVDFNLFISSLGMQALMALGEIESPISGKKEKQLPQAKYIIDTMEMLQGKTKGNLSQQEASSIEQMLYELRMKYITLSKD